MPVEARRLIRLVACAAPALLGAACAEITVPPLDRLDVGIVVLDVSDPPGITMPDTVDLGERFSIEITTLGNGCRRVGETELEVVVGRLRLIPLDWLTTGIDCDPTIRSFEHEAEWAYGTSGPQPVTIRGRIGEAGPIVSFEDTIWVR